MNTIKRYRIIFFFICILIGFLILNFDLLKLDNIDDELLNLKKNTNNDALCQNIVEEERYDSVVVLKFFNVNLEDGTKSCEKLNRKFEIYFNDNDIYKNLSLIRKKNFYEFINLPFKHEKSDKEFYDIHKETFLFLEKLEKKIKNKKLLKSKIYDLLLREYTEADIFFNINVLQNYLRSPIFFVETVKKANSLQSNIFILNLMEIYIEKLDMNIEFKNELGKLEKVSLSKSIGKNISPNINKNEFYMNEIIYNTKTPFIANPYDIKLKKIDFMIKDSFGKKISEYDLISIDIIDESLITHKRCNSLQNFFKDWSSFTKYENPNNFKIDIEKKEIFLKNTIKIYSSIFFPCEFKIFVLPDTKLLLGHEVNLIFNDNFYVQGEFSNKVSIESLDNNIWGSIIIAPNINFNKNNIVEIDHLLISGGSQTRMMGNEFKGMLSIYNSSVKISNSAFFSNYGEDQLNIVKSDINLTNLNLDNSFSDALDLDWCNGNIDNIKVNNTGDGGDGVDFSYSNIEINNALLNNSKDKGISIGERSNIRLTNVIVDNSLIGIAIKDESFAVIRNTIIKNSRDGISSYIKKNFFSEPQLILDKVSFINVKNEYLN